MKTIVISRKWMARDGRISPSPQHGTAGVETQNKNNEEQEKTAHATIIAQVALRKQEE